MSKTKSTAASEAAPTKEEIVAFLKEQIEVKEYQSALQKINTDIAMNRFLELEALAKIGQLTNTKQDPGIPHIVSQEDLDNNPHLVEMGIKVGDNIRIPTPPGYAEEANMDRTEKANTAE